MKKILVIDDQKDNLITIKAVIKSNILDCKIFTTLSGKEGIQIAKNEQPDVILLDIIMPHMDGYEVCEILKADDTTKHIPIVMITAIRTDSESRVKGLDMGADAFLSKPIDPIEFSAQVKVMLRIKEAEDKLRDEKEVLEEKVLERTKDLIKSKERFETIIKEAPISIVVTDKKGDIEFFNDKFIQNFGYTLDDVSTAEEWWSFAYPNMDYRLMVQESWRNAIDKAEKSDTQIETLELDLTCKDGSVRYCEFNMMPLGEISVITVNDITERKNAELALVESESQFRELFENSPIPMWEEDFSEIKKTITELKKKGISDFRAYFDKHPNQVIELANSIKILRINQSVLKLHEAKSKDELLKGLDQVFTPDSYISFIGEIIAIAEDKTKFEFEGVVKTMKGNEKNVQLNWVVVPGYEETLERVYVSTIDITDRKKAEEAIIESENKMSSIYRIAPTGIGIVKDRIFIEINPRICEMTGYSKEELTGKNSRVLYPSQKDFEYVGKEKYKQIERNGTGVVETRWKKKNGSIIDILLSSTPIDVFDYTKGMIFTALDITERKQIEEKLKESEERFRQITENSQEWVWEVDAKGLYTYASPVMESLIGYKPEEIVGKKHFYDLFIPEERLELKNAALKVFKQKKPFYDFENRNLSKNGKIVWLSTSGIPKLDEKGKLIGYRGADINITQRKRSEQIQKVLYNISNAVISTDNFGEFIELIRIELGSVIDTKNYYIAFYNEKTDMISLPFMADEKDSAEDFPAGKSMTAYVIKNKKPLLVNADQQEEMVKDGILEFVGPRSKIWLGVPLEIENKVQGALVIQSYTDEKAYDKSDMEMIEFIADQISILIERKKAEEALRLSEGKYRTLIETASEGFWLIDTKYITLEVNKSLCDMLGYSRNEIIGKTPFEFVDDTNLKIFKHQISKSNSARQRNYEISLRSKSGYNIPTIFSATSTVDSKGNSAGSFAFVTNIANLKQAEELIKQSQERFNLAMQAAQDGLYDWNLLTNKIFYSARWKEILGYKNDELPDDLSIWEKLTQDEGKVLSLRKLDYAIQNKISHYDVEFKMKHKNGHWVDILSRAQVIFNDKNEAIRAVGIHSDITERKKAEIELKNALAKATESDRLKSTFLATMSHELRTPLNAIIGFSDLIDKSLPIADIINFNNTVNKSGKHLLNIVEDLFDITLIETGEMKIIKENVELESLLKEVHEIIKAEQNKTKKTNLDLNLKIPLVSENFSIYTDSSKLKQILLNLLKNALKFTHNGHVTYGFEIETNHSKSMLKFFVEDTGIGIPLLKQEFVFDVFRQVEDSDTKNYGGTGIGLSISKKLAELLGGEIWLESEEGRGSVFYFTIPLVVNVPVINEIKTELESERTEQMLKQSNQQKKTILIVEDVIESYEYLNIILERSGYKTLWAKNGEQSIKLCQENSTIDLVLMDINMPVMNGFLATKEIKKFKPKLPIIAQTAYAIVGDRQKSLDAGCDDYISKPIKQADLHAIIDKHI